MTLLIFLVEDIHNSWLYSFTNPLELGTRVSLSHRQPNVLVGRINILKKYSIRNTCLNTNNIDKIVTNNKYKTVKFSISGDVVMNVMLSITVKLAEI